ncbi:MAG: TonB-dependent receptor, partial [Bacteroidota bacterium]
GNEQGYSPHWNGNISANYEHKIGNKLTFFTGLDYIFQSDMYFDPENAIEQEAYALLNGRLGIGFRKLEATVWAKNITDKIYYSYGYGVGLGNSFASYGLPRTYGITLANKF